jgi:ankyrin repeat protein
MSLEEEAARPRVRLLIKEALRRHNISTLAALMDAAIVGNADDVLAVSRMEFDLNAVNYDGQTALHLMAFQARV